MANAKNILYIAMIILTMKGILFSLINLNITVFNQLTNKYTSNVKTFTSKAFHKVKNHEIFDINIIYLTKAKIL